jgi:hypothetical protein
LRFPGGLPRDRATGTMLMVPPTDPVGEGAVC